MIRRVTCFLITLAILLGSFALAEQPAYEPGSITRTLFEDALSTNVLLAGDIQFKLSGDPEKMGITGRYAEQFNALASLSSAKLTLAAGRIDNGARIEIAAHDGDTGVSADAALNITYDGLLAETSLLPGECVSVRWETLLALMGVPQDQAALILSLRDMDLNAAAASVLAQAAPMLEMAGECIAPYGRTIADFIQSLPADVRTDVPADGRYPAAAQRISLPVSRKDVGSLVTILADQLENDVMLSMLLNSVLAQQEDIPMKNTQELCAAIRAAAANMNNPDHPVYFHIGLDELGTPLYLSIVWEAPDATYLVFDVVHTENAGASQVLVDLGTRDAAGGIVDDFLFTISSLVDPANPRILNLDLELLLQEAGDQLFHTGYSLSSKALITADNQSGYSADHRLSLSIPKISEPLTVEMTASTQNAPTAAGGEYYLAGGLMDITVDTLNRPFRFAHEMTTTPGSSGPVTVYTEKNSVAEQGLDNAEQIFTLYTKAYDPAETAALKCHALETMTEEEMEALINTLIANAEALEKTLPEGVLYFLSEIF